MCILFVLKGFYCLNLSKSTDRKCLEMLIRSDEKYKVKTFQKAYPGGFGYTGDCSQLGDWYALFKHNSIVSCG